jgi:hypothetical protein
MINNLKSKAYATLDMCGFGHDKAKREGFRDGWDMLLQLHDDSATAIFHINLRKELSQKQIVVLYDSIVEEYLSYPNFMSYILAVSTQQGNGVPPYARRLKD